MKKNIAFFLLSIFIISSCKKYPDGPLFSLRSPIQRITGTWNLDTYTKDGNDATGDFAGYTVFPGLDLRDPSNGDTLKYIIRGGIDTIQFVSNIGFYKFSSDKKQLTFTPKTLVNQLSLGGPLISNQIITYTILRLKKSSLWIETDFDGSHYELHYKR